MEQLGVGASTNEHCTATPSTKSLFGHNIFGGGQDNIEMSVCEFEAIESISTKRIALSYPSDEQGSRRIPQFPPEAKSRVIMQITTNEEL